MKIFNKILIANRGEIAVRVIKSAKKLGIQTVVIYSNIEEDSLHIKLADEAYCIGTSDLADSYLNIKKIIDLAKKTGAEAIHPGYGFLSENPDFVDACEQNNIAFVGPHKKAVLMMGNKIEARTLIHDIGIPYADGKTGTKEELLEFGKSAIFPLLVKAAAGGGGKGMRIVRSMSELEQAIETTSREALSYFGNGDVFVEKFIENPRHIEIQIIGDNHGNVIHLYDRECSVQRRYQKIVEESPSPTINQEVREKMGAAAVKIAKNINYNNAGTIEFLVDEAQNFYFLEMNTRVQVEHPVTEMVTGIDIVEQQLLIAANNPLEVKQEDVMQTGHAIESRIYAENPANNFMPSPGDMFFYKEPNIEGIRIDTGIEKACEIFPNFDPMIAKLIVWGETREIATQKSISALQNYIIHGIDTNISYLISLLSDKNFTENLITTTFCDNHSNIIIDAIEEAKKSIPTYLPLISYLLYDFNKSTENKEDSVWNKIGYWREVMEIKMTLDEEEISLKINEINNQNANIEIDGEIFDVKLKAIESNKIKFTVNNSYYQSYISDCDKGNTFVTIDGNSFNIRRFDILSKSDDFFQAGKSAGNDSNIIESPMHGKIIQINVNKGDAVKEGDVVLIVEAMKMENNIEANKDAEIELINIKVGDSVKTGDELIIFKK